MIGGVLFKTDNRNQQDEIDFGQELVDAVVANFTITSGDAPVNGGVVSTGTSANKGVLFETTSGWSSNPPWEERLYHTNPDTPTSSRGLAVLLEIDNFRNISVDDHLNLVDGKKPFEPAYVLFSNAIAQAIVNKINE